MELIRWIAAISVGGCVSAAAPVWASDSDASTVISKKNERVETRDTVENVVVTGARIEGANAAQTTVLDADDMRLINSASSVDLLRNSVGIDVVQPGGPGGVTELFIRGAESNFTVVTVDGVRMNDTTHSRGGGFDLSTLNPDEIERVEILRGPLSAIYGSDALAGAINIKTRDPRASAPFVGRVEGGNDGFLRAYTGVTFPVSAQANGPVASVSASYLDAGEPVPHSTAKTRTFAAKLDWLRSEDRKIDYSVRKVNRQRSGYPSASGGYEYAVSDELETAEADDLTAAAHWQERFSEALLMDVRLTHFNRSENVDSPAVDGGVLGAPIPAAQSESELRRNKFEGFAVWQAAKASSAPLKIVLGASIETEHGENTTVYDYGFPLEGAFDLSRDTHAVFTELNYHKADGLDVFASARWDKTENVEGELSSKLALRYPLAESTFIGFSWGEAFKLPSFYAVADSLVGNPDLLPESSDTMELLFEQFLLNSKLKLTGTVFDSSYTNLIDFDFATFKMVNVASVDVTGAEAEALYRIKPNIELGIHTTYTDYHVEEGEPLDGRPNWRGGLFGEWHTGDWSSRLHWSMSGKRTSTSTATGRVELDAYHRLDLAIGKRMSDKLTLSLNVDNLFDETYYDEVGFPSAGVGARLGVSYRH